MIYLFFSSVFYNASCFSKICKITVVVLQVTPLCCISPQVYSLIKLHQCVRSLNSLTAKSWQDFSWTSKSHVATGVLYFFLALWKTMKRFSLGMDTWWHRGGAEGGVQLSRSVLLLAAAPARVQCVGRWWGHLGGNAYTHTTHAQMSPCYQSHLKVTISLAAVSATYSGHLDQ